MFARLWARLVSFVAAPGDDDEALRKKRLLLVVVLAKAPVCPSLAIAYYTLGVPLAALVPVVYQVLTVASVIAFLVTRNFERFRSARPRLSAHRRASRPERATYQAPIVGVLPEAPEMLELGSSGLFTLRSPHHPLSLELRRVATRLETGS